MGFFTFCYFSSNQFISSFQFVLFMIKIDRYHCYLVCFKYKTTLKALKFCYKGTKYLNWSYFFVNIHPGMVFTIFTSDGNAIIQEVGPLETSWKMNLSPFMTTPLEQRMIVKRFLNTNPGKYWNQQTYNVVKVIK